MTAKTVAPAKAPSEALLLEIAAKHFFLETLETRNSDGLDFQEVSVWAIRSALEASALLREVADLERDDDGDVILGVDANGHNDLMSRITDFVADHNQ